jgi:hypothetical protein
VVSDVGECLVDETREYGTWADWLGVPRHTFSAVFGGSNRQRMPESVAPGLNEPENAGLGWPSLASSRG